MLRDFSRICFKSKDCGEIEDEATPSQLFIVKTHLPSYHGNRREHACNIFGQLEYSSGLITLLCYKEKATIPNNLRKMKKPRQFCNNA